MHVGVEFKTHPGVIFMMRQLPVLFLAVAATNNKIKAITKMQVFYLAKGNSEETFGIQMMAKEVITAEYKGYVFIYINEKVWII